MKRIRIMNRFTLVILAFAAHASAASTPIDETLSAESAQLLDVENASGAVTIAGSDGREVRVRGRLADAASGLEVRQDGSRIIVHVLYPEGQRNPSAGNDGTVLEISAPRTLDISVNTVSAGVTLRDMHGEQSLNSVSGSINTMLYAAEIRARTVSGNIEIEGSDARTRADVASVSGRVELESLSGEVNAQTVSGGVSLRSKELDRAELKSVSGNITVDATMSRDSRLRAMTTSGGISLDLNDSPAGRYEISSFSGSVSNCFGPTATRPQFGPPSTSLRFEEADASAQVFANSMSGTIEICK
jgi:hypothetical protein